MPKSRVSRRAKAKRKNQKVNDRQIRIKNLENMYEDLKVHEAAALEVERMKQNDLEHTPGEGDEGRDSGVDGDQ